MAAAKRKRKLTNREKVLRAQSKKHLQDEGVISPDKKRLNRKKFAEDILNTVYGGDFNFYEHLPHLIIAFQTMTPYFLDGKVGSKVTPEHVGALKVLKIASEIKKVSDKKAALQQGVTVGELYDEVIAPIVNL